MKVRTRFAPSPTGFLHVGGVRTALFAWLVARQANGQFILRIEDTDRSRHVAESEQHIVESLKWLGLDWDEGPIRQSERLDIYKQWAQRLVDSERAYADPYSSAELEALRQKSISEKRPFLFRNHRPDKPPVWDGSQPLRFKSEPKNYKWHDEVIGDLSTGAEAVDDFILMKPDGYPTYNFAHIVDDHLMEISHVIRSQEFLPSMPKFLNLYDALNIDRPKFATLPYVMEPNGKKKLSKRDGAKDILDYRNEGYLPEALISVLGTLGWHDSSHQEIFSKQELIQRFSLTRVQKGGARFDEQKLLWVNSQLLHRMNSDEELDRLVEMVEWPASARGAAIYYKREVMRGVKDTVKTLSSAPELLDVYFNDNYELSPELLKSSAAALDNPTQVLETIKSELEQSDFTPDNLESVLRTLVNKLNIKPKNLFGLIRVAITGKEVSPGLWVLLSNLDEDKSVAKKKALNRLERAIALLDKQT